MPPSISIQERLNSLYESPLNPNFAYVSLQKHDGQSAAIINQPVKLVDVGGGLNEFSDTPAVIQALDLSVTVGRNKAKGVAAFTPVPSDRG